MFGQTQTPVVHVAPVAQRMPQAPQFASSLYTSWHAPPLHEAVPVRQRHMLDRQS